MKTMRMALTLTAIVITLLLVYTSAINHSYHENNGVHLRKTQFKTWTNEDGDIVAISNARLAQKADDKMADFPPLPQKWKNRRKKRATALSASDIEQVLTMHNNFRSGEGASDMRYMVGD